MKIIAKKIFWATYDNLGGLLLLNLTWSILSLPWAMVGYALFVLGASGPGLEVFIATFLALELVLFSPPTLLLFAAGMRWAGGEAVQLRILFDEVKKLAFRGQVLGLIFFFTSLLLVVNIYFYRQVGGWAGLILCSTMVWFLIVLLLMSPYLFPLLILRKGDLWGTLSQCFLLMVDNIKLSIGLFLAILLILFIGAASVAGLFCGLSATIALMVCICFRELLPKYTGQQLPEETPRKFRELIRPWEV